MPYPPLFVPAPPKISQAPAATASAFNEPLPLPIGGEGGALWPRQDHGGIGGIDPNAQQLEAAAEVGHNPMKFFTERENPEACSHEAAQLLDLFDPLEAFDHEAHAAMELRALLEPDSSHAELSGAPQELSHHLQLFAQHPASSQHAEPVHVQPANMLTEPIPVPKNRALVVPPGKRRATHTGALPLPRPEGMHVPESFFPPSKRSMLQRAYNSTSGILGGTTNIHDRPRPFQSLPDSRMHAPYACEFDTHIQDWYVCKYLHWGTSAESTGTYNATS